MTLIRKAQQPSFIGKLARAEDVRAALVFGSDVGGVRELGQRIIRAVLGEAADDALALETLDEEGLKEDPGRLADEAQAISMFGGRRVVLVRDAGKAFLDAFRPLLEQPAWEAFIVALAPGLKKDSALVKLFEKDKRLAALPVYADDAGDVGRLIEDVLAEHGLGMDRDARQALAPLLGGDRQASRNELEKLALYCRGRQRITLEDVRAVCSDVSAHMMSDMLDAFFGGQAARGLALFATLLAEGTPPAAMLSAAASHVARLKALRGVMAEGLSAEQAVAKARPPIFFRRRGIMARQLAAWPEEKLARADESIWQAMHRTRQMPELEAQLAERCLLVLALQAGQRRAA